MSSIVADRSSSTVYGSFMLSTSPVLAFPNEICGFRFRHAGELDRRQSEDVTRRARLQPDGVRGQNRLVHEDAGSREGKIGGGRRAHLVAARGRGELPF